MAQGRNQPRSRMRNITGPNVARHSPSLHHSLEARLHQAPSSPTEPNASLIAARTSRLLTFYGLQPVCPTR